MSEAIEPEQLKACFEVARNFVEIMKRNESPKLAFLTISMMINDVFDAAGTPDSDVDFAFEMMKDMVKMVRADGPLKAAKK